MKRGADVPSRELMLLASLGANGERELRSRKSQIAYRRFATFPRKDIGPPFRDPLQDPIAIPPQDDRISPSKDAK
jgi:hypothetical protein